MKYMFKLEWDELDEFTRNEKIAAAVAYLDANGEYADLEERELTDDEVIEIKTADAEKSIKAHFPVYF